MSREKNPRSRENKQASVIRSAGNFPEDDLYINRQVSGSVSIISSLLKFTTDPENRKCVETVEQQTLNGVEAPWFQ